MRIAVNTRFLLSDYLEGYGYFIYETFKRIVKKHPEHEFIFIFDRPFDKNFIFSENVKAVVTGPPARHPLLWKLWYDVKIPSVLRRYKPDIFVSCDGFCSMTIKIPQCLVIHDLAFLHFPLFNKTSHTSYYKRNTPKFLSKARSIATVSEFSKQDIISNYKTDPSKIDVVYSAAKEIFRPANELQKNRTKEKYTEGKEYFVYTGAIHPRKNLINLLKAFSVFKKRMQTNMKLVLAGRLAWKYDSFLQSLKTYKYRNDVLLTGYVKQDELVNIINSAYALIYPSLWEGFGVPVLESMQCNIPVVTSLNSSMQEIAKDAALYTDPADYNEIAGKMMLLYKDESLRKQLIQKGEKIALQYSWDKTSELLWQSIIKAKE
ncbi:MAG TPA: glycosyltransferase family 1 protein [Chitinophagaceae bacterium]|nr:glycosyltransferase family 1 protein [Chitinophagaceae bacterium]